MKNNRKGFTTVELVIVIAVIAILAAVLIPTFSGLITKANKSADMQAAKNAYSQYVANVDYAKGETAAKVVYVQIEDEYFKVDDGKASDTATALPAGGEVIIGTDGDVICAKHQDGDDTGTTCDTDGCTITIPSGGN